MPRLDRYGSQPPIELLRQYQDFGGFYDRNKLFWKDIQVTLGFKWLCVSPCKRQWNVVHSFVRVAITKYHRLGNSNCRNLFSPSSRRGKSKVKISVGLLYSVASLLGLQMAMFSLCLLMIFSLCPSLFKLSLLIRRHQSYWIKAHLNDFLLTKLLL